MVLFSANVHAGKVRILLMGDSQKTTDQKPADFISTMDKLLKDTVTNVADFILQMGDITEDDKISCWEAARTGWYKLDGKMPYVLNVGNNDGSGGNFIKYFPLSKYKAWPSFVSNFNDHRNVAHHFNAGGVDWLVISILRFPGSSEVSWAEGLLKNNPKRKVIIVNHTLNLGDGNIVWNMAKKYPNVVFAFLGHNVVMHEMLHANDGHNVGRVQTCWHSTQKDSYLCVANIDTYTGTCKFRYYSPLYGKYHDDPTAPGHDTDVAHKPWTWTGFDFGAQQTPIDNNKMSLSASSHNAFGNFIALSGNRAFQFDLETPADVLINLYSMAGHLVAAKKIKGASGKNSIAWSDIEAQPNAMYIVELQKGTGDRSVIRAFMNR
jgi:hypothetical protein